MAIELGDCFDHFVGGRSVPAASTGYGTPVGVPNPKSRSASYSSRAENRSANCTIPMLLE